MLPSAGEGLTGSREFNMTWHAAGLRRLDGIIWALVAAVAGLELLAIAADGFSLVLQSYATPTATCLGLLLAARYYSARRQDPNLASALECTAQEVVELGRASSLALRYVGARLTCDNTSTRVETTYIRGLAKRPCLDLTASKTS